ncbi:MAG: DUF192 domain-containing protein [Rhodospirillaceae bacterium]|nr:DUF192 domain-containing protein [Rhodospirillaceae bacterium]
MTSSRRKLGVLAAFALWVGLAACASGPAAAQLFRPHEPLDPAKAQSLAFTPLSIQTKTAKLEFQVEVADTDTKRSTGLMHRTELAADKGMLFDFKTPRPVSFWMRNTFIALDMIFISSDGTIAAIAENTIPHNDKGVGPDMPVLAVLEVAGGVSKAKGIAVGDIVSHAIFERAK